MKNQTKKSAAKKPESTKQGSPETYQDRVMQEKKELDEKRVALDAFLKSGKCEEIPLEEHKLLMRQNQMMIDYSAILDRRIDTFK